eukprot:CAMPEP_0201480058 /NCGR_PEP_ID=MMETSP0151_2-20130828/4638_1 /ASSEMBLY_ACC=CAM_ASM_000257 /TAXON_ID=200890 /ORGANISM="Paramoeba atlantica, Strain 621/1 / CCAP 1560/9" /LENGTH=137 /DNA_ID=CAMNT_0047861809 /DNA_START=44 /DNA_END=457 /DNA_ORIENTATION=+
MKLAVCFVFLCVAVSFSYAAINAASPHDPKIAFNDANACTKAITCFQYLMTQLLPDAGASTPWDLTNLAFVPPNAVVADPSTFTNEIAPMATPYCDFPEGTTSIIDCLGSSPISNGVCLENFNAQLDACVNAFINSY